MNNFDPLTGLMKPIGDFLYARRMSLNSVTIAAKTGALALVPDSRTILPSKYTKKLLP